MFCENVGFENIIEGQKCAFPRVTFATGKTMRANFWDYYFVWEPSYELELGDSCAFRKLWGKYGQVVGFLGFFYL